MKTLIGVIRGCTIELLESPDFCDGVEVEVVITRTLKGSTTGAGFAATEGALANDDEWDAIMQEVETSRRWERVTQNGAR